MSIYRLQAVANRELRIPVRDSADTTGLLIGSFSLTAVAAGVRLSDPVADLSMALDEIDDVNIAGYYELVLTPTEAGLLYLRAEGTDDHEFHVQVLHESIDVIGNLSYGAEGSVTLTVEDSGSNPLEGVVVRVLTSSGSGLVARGITDASGEVSFDLPAGTYYTRYSKTGYDFDSYNPTEIEVDPYESIDPYIEFLLPTTASVGDTVAILGRYYHGDNLTVLVEGSEVVPDEISEDKTLTLFTVPAGSGSATIQLRKDDPDNPGEYLTSAINTLTIS